MKIAALIFNIYAIIYALLHQSSLNVVEANISVTEVIYESNNNNSLNNNTIHYDIPMVFTALRWMDDIQNTNDLVFQGSESPASLPVIPIDAKFGDYDPCAKPNENTAAIFQSSLQGYLEELNESARFTTSLDINDGWIASINNKQMLAQCDGIHSYHLYYVGLSTYYAQEMGAKALLMNLSFEVRTPIKPKFGKTYVPPEYDEIGNMVNGVKILIPTYIFKTSEEVDFSTPSIAFEEEALNEDNPLSFFYLNSPIEVEVNPFDVIFDPIGLFACMYYILGLISISISTYTVVKLPTVITYFTTEKDSNSSANVSSATAIKSKKKKKAYDGRKAKKFALLMRLLILIPEIVIGVLRLYHCPFYLKGHMDFIQIQLISSFLTTLACFTDIITTMYCRDVYQIFRASANLRPAPAPFLVRYKFGSVFICSLAVVMIFLDQYGLGRGLRKEVPRTDATPMIYILLTNLIVTVTLFRMSHMMKKEVKQLDTKCKENIKESEEATAALTKTQKKNITTAAIGAKSMLQRTAYFLRVRSFIFAAACGRFGTIIGLGLFVAQIHVVNTTTYFLCVALYQGSAIISSVFQCLGALELPNSHSNKDNSNGMTTKQIKIGSPKITPADATNTISTAGGWSEKK